ncbi:hypothetical protein F9C07_1618223 [Aspergillus flavus]|uniref:Uncharacterized protein n=2 Tax=Aspergillus flavus TaxID=5059 RepID=A0A7U2MH38_ASPFN|nr:hypothetical protein AFLA_005258 [Aspergillus flavus NRRL3357]QRD83586.1 hypothetical protein F9C07_1618223 [Aspergillus flavus]UDD57101.1 hypothetical protein AFCA_004616 [Aspergillus flavus]
MYNPQRAMMFFLQILVLLFPLLTLVHGVEIIQPAQGDRLNAMDGLIVRWKYNSSHDPLEADFQIGQEGYNIVPHAIVKLNARSIAFAPEHVTRLLGPSAFVRIWNADWIPTSSVKELAKVDGFTLTTWTTLVSMTSSIPSTTTIRPGTITSTSVSNSSLSTTEQPKTTMTMTAIPDPMLEESSPRIVHKCEDRNRSRGIRWGNHDHRSRCLLFRAEPQEAG